MSAAIGVLRPEPGNAATARRLEDRGRRALRLPLFAVHGIAWSTPNPAAYDALLLTSANALRHGGAGLDRLRHLPVHAVGAATAAAARDAGFEVVAIGETGVDALVLPRRVLRLVGRDYHAISGTDDIVVYATMRLRPDLAPLAGGIALVHSPRSARALANEVADRAGITIAAISEAAAAAAGTGWRAVAVASRPTDAALIDVAIGLDD